MNARGEGRNCVVIHKSMLQSLTLKALNIIAQGGANARSTRIFLALGFVVLVPLEIFEGKSCQHGCATRVRRRPRQTTLAECVPSQPRQRTLYFVMGIGSRPPSMRLLTSPGLPSVGGTEQLEFTIDGVDGQPDAE